MFQPVSSLYSIFVNDVLVHFCPEVSVFVFNLFMFKKIIYVKSAYVLTQTRLWLA